MGSLGGVTPAGGIEHARGRRRRRLAANSAASARASRPRADSLPPRAATPDARAQLASQAGRSSERAGAPSSRSAIARASDPPCPGEDRQELVAAIVERRGPSLRRPPASSPRRRAENPVAGRVAEPVVDRLEPVEIDHQAGQRRSDAAAARRAEATRNRTPSRRFARPVKGSVRASRCTRSSSARSTPGACARPTGSPQNQNVSPGSATSRQRKAAGSARSRARTRESGSGSARRRRASAATSGGSAAAAPARELGPARALAARRHCRPRFAATITPRRSMRPTSNARELARNGSQSCAWAAGPRGANATGNAIVGHVHPLPGKSRK